MNKLFMMEFTNSSSESCEFPLRLFRLMQSWRQNLQPKLTTHNSSLANLWNATSLAQSQQPLTPWSTVHCDLQWRHGNFRVVGVARSTLRAVRLIRSNPDWLVHALSVPVHCLSFLHYDSCAPLQEGSNGRKTAPTRNICCLPSSVRQADRPIMQQPDLTTMMESTMVICKGF